MLDLTKRGFKKPLENEAYDVKVTNFNTDLIETELDKLMSREGDGKDITVTFTESAEDAELKSNSKLSILFGLIKKKFSLFLQSLESKADLISGKVKVEQLPDMDYAPTNHTHNDKLSTNGNGSDVKVNFIEASADADIQSGENATTLFGKIKKRFSTIATTLSSINTALSNKAATNHGSYDTTYGVGTTTTYGHVKTINDLTQSTHLAGTALAAYQGKLLNDKISANNLTSYMQFCANINTYAIDAAFGKGNENRVLNLGMQLAMYAWFKGTSEASYPFASLKTKDKFIDVINDEASFTEVIENSNLFSLITSSTYAKDKMGMFNFNKSDLVLYEAGNATYLNTASATINKNFSQAYVTFESDNIHMYCYSDTSNNNGLTQVTIPIKNLPPSKFKKYKYIKVKFHPTKNSYLPANYVPGSFRLNLDGTNYIAKGNYQMGETITLTNTIEVSANIWVDLWQQSGTNITMYCTGAPYNGGTHSHHVYIYKIWLTDTL